MTLRTNATLLKQRYTNPVDGLKSKYWAKKIEIDWIKFASQLEGRFYSFFIERNIPIISLQPRYILQESFRFNGELIRAIEYRADFIIEWKGKQIVIEAKWMETPEWKIKKKIWLKKYWDDNILLVAKSIKSLSEQLLLMK